MEDEIKEIPEKIEKYGLIGGIGMLLLIIVFLLTFPVTSIEKIKELNGKEIIILALSIVGLILIAIALLRKNRGKLKANTKLLKDKYDYPKEIETAIASQLYNRDFFKEDIDFIITVENVQQTEITMTTELSYSVTNRSNEQHTWFMEYKFKNENGKLIEASFDGDKITESPDIHYGRGIRILQEMQAKQKSKVYFKVTEKFRNIDFELFTSYHPATEMTLTIDNKFSSVIFDYEYLYFNPITPKKVGTQTKLVFKDGLLPYQGVRINWKTS